jgi:hypothetical protein
MSTTPQNRRQLVRQNEDCVYKLYQEKALEHLNANKIASYIVSNHTMNVEQQRIADGLFTDTVRQVAKDLGIKLVPEPMNRHTFIQQHQYHIKDIFDEKVLQHPDSGKLTSYIISDGKLNVEQKQTITALKDESVSEAAAAVLVTLV